MSNGKLTKKHLLPSDFQTPTGEILLRNLRQWKDSLTTQDQRSNFNEFGQEVAINLLSKMKAYLSQNGNAVYTKILATLLLVT